MASHFPEMKGSHGTKRAVTAYPIPGDPEGLRLMILKVREHLQRSWKNDQLSEDAVRSILTFMDIAEERAAGMEEENPPEPDEPSLAYKLLAERVDDIAEMFLEDIDDDCAEIIKTMEDILNRLRDHHEEQFPGSS